VSKLSPASLLAYVGCPERLAQALEARACRAALAVAFALVRGDQPGRGAPVAMHLGAPFASSSSAACRASSLFFRAFTAAASSRAAFSFRLPPAFEGGTSDSALLGAELLALLLLPELRLLALSEPTSFRGLWCAALLVVALLLASSSARRRPVWSPRRGA